MKPTTRDNYVGIEIEVLSKEDRETVQEYVEKFKLDTNIAIGTDSSIEAYDDYNLEDQLDSINGNIEYLTESIENLRAERDAFKIGSKRREASNNQIKEVKIRMVSFLKEKETIQTLLKNLDKDSHLYTEGLEIRLLSTEKELDFWYNELAKMFSKFKFKVNNSCGLHVHLDMRQRDAEECARRLYSKIDDIKSMIDKSRHDNEYCKFTNLTSTLSGLKNKEADRRKAINTAAYHEHTTIEVRAHEGTTDISKIKGWVSFLVDTIEGKNKAKAAL